MGNLEQGAAQRLAMAWNTAGRATLGLALAGVVVACGEAGSAPVANAAERPPVVLEYEGRLRRSVDQNVSSDSCGTFNYSAVARGFVVLHEPMWLDLEGYACRLRLDTDDGDLVADNQDCELQDAEGATELGVRSIHSEMFRLNRVDGTLDARLHLERQPGEGLVSFCLEFDVDVVAEDGVPHPNASEVLDGSSSP
jgi:hypothetical protein